MQLFRVLHLSDIHIGDTYIGAKDIAYRIIADIENDNLKGIRSVVVTGDIFEGRCGFNDSLVSEAVDFFNIIYEELKESSDIQKTDFLFVPGNHDIMRKKNDDERWEKYSAFLNAFYETIPDFYNRDDFSILKIYEDSRIVFAGFNSCGLREEPIIDCQIIKNINKIADSEYETNGIAKEELIAFIEEQGKTKTLVDYGEITPKQIVRMRRKLKKYDDYNIVAFFHHHFYLFPEVYSKYGDSSLIRNYTNIIQQLQNAKVKTVLHGHKHFDLERPLITDDYYENINNVINIIAGGSVGTKRVAKHTFNIIDFYDKDSDIELVQRKFVYNNDQLAPIVIRQIPPKATNYNNSIRLLKVLEINNPKMYSLYVNSIDKINIAIDDYSNMVNWLENVFTGFEEIHKIFETNNLCVFFLLYAMNYRILKAKELLGKENIDTSYYDILNNMLLDESIQDVGFDKEQYLKIFEQSDLNTLKDKGDEIFNTCQNKIAKYYLSFSMIGIFITDVYLMLRYYVGSFYNRYIKYKVNIKLEETEFHQNVPVHKIMIRSDADRRSAFIDLKCNSATAHKLAVLFVKEFELRISQFEDYFKTVGLKLYYLTPKIEKNNMTNAIDNYNFEAYIPTLIPLLTGDNIYAKKEVFARELIQNSIDAIAVRASSDSDFDQTIYITLGEKQGKKFFRIKDYGTGMDRFKIERYFTSIGRSFYSGDEYRELEIDYKPISNFGIGFLSAFMICREIDVKTRYYLDEGEGLRLHIPNYDGCFFIEKDEALDVGTEITLYIDKKISNDIQTENIIEYIHNTMRDISYDIVINDEISNKKILIASKSIRKNMNNNDLLFIPFLDSGKIEENVSIEKTVRSNEFLTKYPYGLLIDLTGKNYTGTILNSGIKIYDTDVEDILCMLFDEKLRVKSLNKFFAFNFPSNYLNIDVSREKITSLTEVVNSNFSLVLLTEISKQIVEYITLSKMKETGNKAINLHVLMMSLVHLCRPDSMLEHLQNNIMRMRYILYIRFHESTIDLLVSNVASKPADAVAYIQSNYSKCQELFKNFITKNLNDEDVDFMFYQSEYVHESISKVLDLTRRHTFWSDINVDGTEYAFYRSAEEMFQYEITEWLKKILRSKDDIIVYTFLLLSAFLMKRENGKEHIGIMGRILDLLLRSYTIFEIENGKGIISIGCDDILKVIKRLK